MCKFFSLVSDGEGKPYYFDWELRKKVLSGELKDYYPDSHTSIADYFGFKKEKEDKLNKYEYNPFLKKFEIDQLNTKDDSSKIERFCKQLDFKKIIEPIKISPIIRPFKIKVQRVAESDITLVREWASARDSVRDSSGYSVWASVRDSVGDSVGDSAGASVWDSVVDSVRDSVVDSVRDSVGASVWDSAGASVWDSVVDSVWDSVGAYTSSFFNINQWKYIKHEKGINPYQPCIDLWKKGLVPSFDGTTWRLHGGENGKILWEGKL